jgi:hypothetical protein
MNDPHLVYSCTVGKVQYVDHNEVHVQDLRGKVHHVQPDFSHPYHVGDVVMIEYVDGNWYLVH